MSNPLRILYCHCAYAQVVPAEVKQRVLQKLAESGVAFDAVADLCEMSAKRDPMLNQLAAGGPLKIVACYPRAVRWLFNAADAPLPPEGVEIRNMRTETAEQVLAGLFAARGEDEPPADSNLTPIDGARPGDISVGSVEPSRALADRANPPEVSQ